MVLQRQKRFLLRRLKYFINLKKLSLFKVEDDIIKETLVP